MIVGFHICPIFTGRRRGLVNGFRKSRIPGKVKEFFHIHFCSFIVITYAK